MDYLGKYSKGSTAHVVAAGKTYFTNLYRNGLIVNATNGPTHRRDGGASRSAWPSSRARRATAVSSRPFPSMRVKYLDMSVALPSVIGIDAKAPAIVRADAQKSRRLVDVASPAST